jgi:hypothetical protein
MRVGVGGRVGKGPHPTPVWVPQAMFRDIDLQQSQITRNLEPLLNHLIIFYNIVNE